MNFVKRRFKVIVLCLFIFRLSLAFGAYHPDVWSNMDWGTRFFEYGPQKFYAPSSNVWSYTWPNQPPGTILLFAVVRKVFEFTFNSIFWINVKIPKFPSTVIPFLEQMLYPFFLKLPSILADFGIACLILKITKNRVVTFLWLVNPVVWYNSAVWGQTDAIINFLALLGFYLMAKKRIVSACLAFALCVFVKISLLIFVPLVVIYLVKQRISIKEVVVGLFVSFVMIMLATYVFSNPVFPLGWLINIYQNRVLVEQLQVITANAFNIWVVIAGINERPQSTMLGPMSYQSWGIILFAAAYLFIGFKYYRAKRVDSIWWALAGSAFSSWMLLTNMHERYLYPLFPYFTILIATYPSLFLMYVFVSLINLLNLYNFWFVPPVDFIVKIMSFSDKIVTRVLGLVDVLLYISFLKYGFFSSDVSSKKKAGLPSEK